MGRPASSEAPLEQQNTFTDSCENRVLIAYSGNFAQEKFFQSKLEKILSGIGPFVVISVNDRNKLIKHAYSDKILESVDIKGYRRSQIRSLVSKATHAIYFWDGSHDICELIYTSTILHKPHRVIAIETTKVANKDRGDEYDVYIGRGSPWGNPFAIWEDGNDRQLVIDKFAQYFEEEILSNPSKRKALLSLKGKILGCHCKPFACHGDVIANYLNSLEDPESDSEN